MWKNIKEFYVDFKSYIVRIESISFIVFLTIFIFSLLTIEKFNSVFSQNINIYYYYGFFLVIYFIYFYFFYFLRLFLYKNKNIIIFNYKDYALSQLINNDLRNIKNKFLEKNKSLIIGKFFYSFTDLDLQFYLSKYSINTILYIYYDENKKGFLVKKFINPNINKYKKIKYFYSFIFNNQENLYSLEDLTYYLFLTHLYLNYNKDIGAKNIFEYVFLNFNNIFNNDNYIKLLYILIVNYINKYSFGENNFLIDELKKQFKLLKIDKEFMQNLYLFFLKDINKKIDNKEIENMDINSIKMIIRFYFEFNYLFYMIFDEKLKDFSKILKEVQLVLDDLGNEDKNIGLTRFLVYNYFIYKNENIDIYVELKEFIIRNNKYFYKDGENFLNNESIFYSFLTKNLFDDNLDEIIKVNKLILGFGNDFLSDLEKKELNSKKNILENILKIFNN